MHDDLVARLGVTPYAGVWIEISRPHELVQSVTLVTPYAGVWIEIIDSNDDNFFSVVTPYAGVWIEISANQLFDNYV